MGRVSTGDVRYLLPCRKHSIRVHSKLSCWGTRGKGQTDGLGLAGSKSRCGGGCGV